MNDSNSHNHAHATREEFAACVKAQLDRSEREIPPHIVSKLRQTRHCALEQTQQRRSWFALSALSQYPWVASCASLLAVAVFIGYVQLQPTTEEQLTAAEVLFADEELELYEDLEFYRWLADTGY